jgi:hypothetical protein
MKARLRDLAGCVASLFLAACAQPTPALLPTQTSELTALPSATARATFTPTLAPPTLTPTATAQLQTLPIVAGGLTFRAPTEAGQAWNTTTRFLESAAFETYAGETLSQAGQTYAYTIQLARDEELIWANGWCAATREQLEVEWPTLSMLFSVNAEPLPENLLALYEAQGAQMFCRWRYAVVSGWPEGVTQLTTRVTLAQTITDEVRTYPAGTHFYKYEVAGP